MARCAAQQAAMHMLIARTISVVSVYLYVGELACQLIDLAINGSVHVLTFRAGMNFTTVYMQCCI
ncbi:hypothetical protein ACLB1M_25550 [Escherichia coli]